MESRYDYSPASTHSYPFPPPLPDAPHASALLSLSEQSQLQNFWANFGGGDFNFLLSNANADASLADAQRLPPAAHVQPRPEPLFSTLPNSPRRPSQQEILEHSPSQRAVEVLSSIATRAVDPNLDPLGINQRMPYPLPVWAPPPSPRVSTYPPASNFLSSSGPALSYPAISPPLPPFNPVSQEHFKPAREREQLRPYLLASTSRNSIPAESDASRTSPKPSTSAKFSKRELLSTDQKRLNHISSEKRRRSAIRDAYQELVDEIQQGAVRYGLDLTDFDQIAENGPPSKKRKTGSGDGRGRGRKGDVSAGGSKTVVLNRAAEYIRWLEADTQRLRAQVANGYGSQPCPGSSQQSGQNWQNY